MQLPAEQRAVREFAIEERRPTAAETDETERFPDDVRDGLAEMDLTALTAPRSTAATATRGSSRSSGSTGTRR